VLLQCVLAALLNVVYPVAFLVSTVVVLQCCNSAVTVVLEWCYRGVKV
jgi:hypothetical protein